MSSVLLRATKGSELSHAELDGNFTSLNTDVNRSLPAWRADQLGFSGDGVTSNNTAWNNVTTGMRVFFPAGEYIINNYELNGKSRVEIFGEAGTVFRCNTTEVVLRFTNTFSDLYIHDIKFENNQTSSANGTEGLITIINTTATKSINNVTIARCAFSAPTYKTQGLKIITESIGGYVRGVKVLACDFTNIGRMGIETQNHVNDTEARLLDMVIQGCYFQDIGTVHSGVAVAAVSISGWSSNVTVDDCTIIDVHTNSGWAAVNYGIENAGAVGMKITNCRILSRNHGFVGILNSATRVPERKTIIDGNVIILTGTDSTKCRGIEAGNMNGCTITNNYVQAYGYALRFDNSSRNKLFGNTFISGAGQDNTAYFTNGSASNIIQNNVFDNSAYATNQPVIQFNGSTTINNICNPNILIRNGGAGVIIQSASAANNNGAMYSAEPMRFLQPGSGLTSAIFGNLADGGTIEFAGNGRTINIRQAGSKSNLNIDAGTISLGDNAQAPKIGANANFANITSTLQSFGSFATAATAAALTSNTTLDATHSFVTVNTAGGNVVLTVPAASGCAGRMYMIKKVSGDANTVTVSTGDGTLTLAGNGDAAIIQSTGASWYIVARNFGALTAANITDFQSQVSANTDVAALKAIVGAGVTDGDTLVNTVSELLAIFSTYTEAVDIVTLINSKAAGTHTHTASNVTDFNVAALAAAPAETATTVGSLINGATAKTTPVDADMFGMADSAASNVLKKVTLANLKAVLKTYFDTLTTTLSGKTLTAPKIISGDAIFDANSNELLKMSGVASAVNEITVSNAATGNRPGVAATGGDTNIDLDLKSKGTGIVRINGNYIPQSTTFFNAKEDVRPRYNQANAVGNGSTDDATALQTAMYASSDEKKIVYIPAGNYVVNSTIQLPYNAMEIRGAGIGKTTITVGASYSGTGTLFNMFGKSDLIISDLTITGNTKRIDAALTINSYETSSTQVRRILLQRVRFYNLWTTNAIMFGGTVAGDTHGMGDITIRDCHFENIFDPAVPIAYLDATARCNAINLNQTTNKLIIANNFIKNVSGDGIYGYGQTQTTYNPDYGDWLIQGNHIERCFMGIEINGQYLPKGISIDNNTIKYCTRDAGYLISIDSLQASITNNRLFGVDRSLIEFTSIGGVCTGNRGWIVAYSSTSGGVAASSMPHDRADCIEAYGFANLIQGNNFILDRAGAGTYTPTEFNGIKIVYETTDPDTQPTSFDGITDLSGYWDIKGNTVHGFTHRAIDATNEKIRKVNIQGNTFLSRVCVENVVGIYGYNWIIKGNIFDLTGSSNPPAGKGAIGVFATQVDATLSLVEGNTIINDNWGYVDTDKYKIVLPTSMMVRTVTSDSTITPPADASDMYAVTALAANASIAAPSGTPRDGQILVLRITSDASPRTLTWNAIYRASTDFALPTVTTASKTMYIQFVYNSAATKWDAVGITNGF